MVYHKEYFLKDSQSSICYYSRPNNIYVLAGEGEQEMTGKNILARMVFILKLKFGLDHAFFPL